MFFLLTWELHIADPELTPGGINQAVEARRGWDAEIALGITLPDKFYSSPLTRALDTLRLTFEGLLWDDVEKQCTVLVVEVSAFPEA
jgi:broad specificity phosphatase PhoE